MRPPLTLSAGLVVNPRLFSSPFPLTGGHSPGFRICDLLCLTPSHSIRSGIFAWSHKIHINFSLKIQSYLAKIFIGNFLGGCFAL